MVVEMNAEKPILVGVIGGSGLYKLDMEVVTTVNPETVSQRANVLPDRYTRTCYTD